MSCCHKGARPSGPGQAALCPPGCAARALWAQPMPNGLCQLPLLALRLAAEREAGCWRCQDLQHSQQCSVLINYPLTFTFISLSAAVTQRGQSLPPWPHKCPPWVYFCFFFTCMFWHEYGRAAPSSLRLPVALCPAWAAPVTSTLLTAALDAWHSSPQSASLGMELGAQLSPMDNTSRGFAAHMTMFSAGHRSVPAYMCPQLMPTCCVPCTCWPWAVVLPAGSHSARPAPAAQLRLELGLRGYPSCAVLGSLPTCTGVEHHGRAISAIGASPSSEHPWHIWTATSWLGCVWCWLHIPYHSLIAPLVCTVLLAGPCRVRVLPGPQLDPSLDPSAHPTHGQAMLGCNGAKQGPWLGWGDPKLPRFNGSPAAAEARWGAAAGILAL